MPPLFAPNICFLILDVDGVHDFESQFAYLVRNISLSILLKLLPPELSTSDADDLRSVSTISGSKAL